MNTDNKTSEPTKRAVIYGCGAEMNSDIVGMQLRSCAQYVNERDWQVIATLADYIDKADEPTPDLPELEQAVEMARAGEYDVLVMPGSIYTGHTVANILVAEGDLKRQGLEIVYVSSDERDEWGGMFRDFAREVVAEFERLMIKRGRARDHNQVSRVSDMDKGDEESEV